MKGFREKFAMGLLCIALGLPATGLAADLNAPLSSTFQGYGGDVEYVGPRNGAIEVVVATHLRSWIACAPKEYMRTVGGFIYERLGGQTTATAMREGLETRYPGNPVTKIALLRVDRMGKGTAEALYEATHKDGTSVQRVLHLAQETQGWRIVRVSRVRK